ncbi:MAG: Hsp20/alpha crystallin family protein [Actinobacteria bacterium]|nr:Hsp20/alpha crystallin family protein [Actinomycetota bacterium]
MEPRDRDNAPGVRRLPNEVDKLFLEMLRGERTPRYGRTAFRPNADVYYDKRENKVVVRLELPGIDPNTVSIEVDANHLRVSGIRVDERHPDAVYQQMEIVYGRFERTVMLPPGVDNGKASANYDSGYLEIVLPVKPRPARRRIRISTQDEAERREER